MSALPTFPTDDATLGAVKHALGANLVGDHIEDADMSFPRLLEFLSGNHGETLIDGDPELAALDIGPRPTYEAQGDWYGPQHVILALIAEVERLRGAS